MLFKAKTSVKDKEMNANSATNNRSKAVQIVRALVFALCFIVAMGALSNCINAKQQSGKGQQVGSSSGRIEEDEPGWNCHTMGNKRCGTEQPATTVNPDPNNDGRIDEDEPGWDCHTMGNKQCGPNAAVKIQEDDPRWDCHTMGNKQCGPGAVKVEER
ncbi:hypothetical protein [Streptomyces sp. NPDC057686]|uniref:hypothetical protein n=1 Tax=Streptomyces sp. NPDC057686 TaxID=3346212 RepID=UPI0036963571